MAHESTYAKEGTLHIECHLLVIEGHDLNQALERANLHRHRRVLSRLADNLHDVIAFALALEVVANELERVVKGRDGRELHF